jgi:hypothetical protein
VLLETMQAGPPKPHFPRDAGAKEEPTMNEIPHIDREPLAGWSIVRVHGVMLIGKRKIGLSLVLEPVFELQGVMSPAPSGSPAGAIVLEHRILPVGLFVSWTSQTIPDGALVKDCEDLSLEERRKLREKVESALQNYERAKAQEAGIVLPMRRP